MFSFLHEYKNINGKAFILSHKLIGSDNEGFEVILKHCNENKFFLKIVVNLSALLAYLLVSYHRHSIESHAPIIAAIALCVTIIHKSCAVLKEKLLVVPSVGLQYSTEYYFGNETRCLIHWEHLCDVIINEAIYRNRVLYVLTAIVQEGPDRRCLKPLFLNTMPKLKCLEMIYTDIQNHLHINK